MFGSGFALICGLVLLGLAVWLLRRASSPSFDDATPDRTETFSPSPEQDSLEGERQGDPIGTHDESPDLEQSELHEGDAGVHVASADVPSEGLADEPHDGTLAGVHDGDADQQDDGLGATASAGPSDNPLTRGFGGVRRRRRQWASEHGFEYTKEDRDLAQDWVQYLGARDGAVPLSRDVVSGFFEGHQTHIADVNGRTLLAMRRDAYSPVSVQYSSSEAMPEGMRRIEALDQSPFVAYCTDIRALDRMLDARVEDGLRALSQVAADVIWDGEWVLLKISRKLDMSVWDQILSHVCSLVDAAMVLPPEHLSIPLEMDVADQTRAMPGGDLFLETQTRALGGGVGTEEQDATPARHLRAMPDADAAVEWRAEDAETAEEESLEDYPEVTRPAEPVVFPSRSTGRSEGDPEEFYGFHVAGVDEDDDGDHIHGDGAMGTLPRLGEDPEHISPSTARYAQVIRTDVEHEATIFDDYPDDYDAEEYEVDEDADSTDSNSVLRAAWGSDGGDGAAGDAGYRADGHANADSAEGGRVGAGANEGEELSHIARLRRDRRSRGGAGRHRAADAKHARPEPIEAVELEDEDIETVDGEIVEDD